MDMQISPTPTHSHQLGLPVYTMPSGNIGLVQPYIFEPETDSEEEE